MLHPVVDINLRHSTDKKLEFSLIKDCKQENLRSAIDRRLVKEVNKLTIDEVLGYQLVEASQEGFELSLNSLLDPPFRNQTLEK